MTCEANKSQVLTTFEKIIAFSKNMIVLSSAIVVSSIVSAILGAVGMSYHHQKTIEPMIKEIQCRCGQPGGKALSDETANDKGKSKEK
jgi:hypothetical protein